jgi:hypothetical protein
LTALAASTVPAEQGQCYIEFALEELAGTDEAEGEDADAVTS